MPENDTEFDYQAILVASQTQIQILEETSKQESQNVQEYKNLLENYKEKVKILEENTATYHKLTLERNELVQKLNKICEKKSSIGRHVKCLQNSISEVYKNLQHESIEIVQVTKNKKEGLKELYDQFEGDILQNLINKCNAKLLATQQTKQQLTEQYNQLTGKICKTLEQYKSSSVLSNIFKSVPKQNEIEAIKMEIKKLNKKSEINAKKIQDLNKKLR